MYLKLNFRGGGVSGGVSGCGIHPLPIFSPKPFLV